MAVQDFLIALGGNAPLDGQSPENTLNQALERLSSAGGELVGLSPFYRTPAYPAGSGPEFVNAAAVVRFGETPGRVMELLHEIETGLGRERPVRWGQRTLDLDLLGVDDCVLPDRKTHEFWRTLPLAAQLEKTPDQLILPHPRLQDRAFVLVPLCDVAPAWCHPILRRTVRQMLSDLPEDTREAIQPL